MRACMSAHIYIMQCIYICICTYTYVYKIICRRIYFSKENKARSCEKIWTQEGCLTPSLEILFYKTNLISLPDDSYNTNPSSTCHLGCTKQQGISTKWKKFFIANDIGGSCKMYDVLFQDRLDS